jgi:site-specific DNA-adenine methylase
MNHFIIPYIGNKRGEFKEFIKMIDINKYNIIVEPFCGTSAISFNIWKNNGKDKTYYLNDLSRDIYDLYQLIKNDTPENILNELNNYKLTITDKETFLREFKRKDKTIYEKLFFLKFYAIRVGLYPLDDRHKEFTFNKEQLLFFEFIKSDNVIITNGEWYNSFNDFKDNENAIFIFDPPYLNSTNTEYKLSDNDNKGKMNVYEYFYNNDISIYKSKVVFILEDIWIIRLLFKNYISSSYGKNYFNISKKKTNHIIINN